MHLFLQREMNNHTAEEVFGALSPFDLNTWLNFSDENKDGTTRKEDLVLDLPGTSEHSILHHTDKCVFEIYR